MIISFGAIMMYFRIKSDDAHSANISWEQTRNAQSYDAGISGKAALQALAAANAGARTALVGKIGDDHYGKNILLKLRQRGVITSGVGRNNTAPTGSHTAIRGTYNDNIISLGASQFIDPDQAPEDILNPSTILLLQDEVPLRVTRPVLHAAKKAKGRTILNLSKGDALTPEDYEALDYLIVTERLEPLMQNALKYEHIQIYVLMNDGRVILRKGKEKPAQIRPVEDEALNWEHPSASVDAFCGTLAAGLYTKMSDIKALRYANIARALSASDPRQHLSMPYIDSVKELYEKTLESQTVT